MPVATQEIQGNVQQFRSVGEAFDYFDRANSGSSLGTSRSGHVWAVESGASLVYGISEQVAYCVSGPQANSGAVILSAQADRLLIEARVRASAEYQAGLIFRSNGVHAGDKWTARLTVVSGLGRLTLTRISAGTPTTIATVDTNLFDENDQVRLGVTLVGSNIKVWLEDTLLVETTDATHATNQRHGILVSVAGVKALDDFAIRPIGGNPPLLLRANLQNVVERSVQLRASVSNVVPQTTTIRAAVTPQVLGSVNLRASILTHARVTETAGEDLTEAEADRVTHEDTDEFSVDRVVLGGQDAYIWTLDTQFLESHEGHFTIRANIRGVTSQSLTMRAKLTSQQIQGVSLRGRIAPRFFKTMFLRARLLGSPSGSFTTRASVRKVVTQEFTIRARIRRIEFGVQMRASVANTVTQTMEMKASITPQEQAKIQLRASIQQIVTKTTTMRARVMPETRLSMRALILGFVTGSVEVDYDVAQRVVTRLPVTFDVTAGEKKSEPLTMRAFIASPRTASLTVEFNVHQSMPDELTTRPTERVKNP